MIIIQSDPDIQGPNDSAKKLTCHHMSRYDKNVTFSPLTMNTIQVEEIVFRGDETIDSWMDIVQGTDPLNPSITTPVTVGDQLTAVIYVKDQSLEDDEEDDDDDGDHQLSYSNNLTLPVIRSSSSSTHDHRTHPSFDVRIKDCFAYDNPQMSSLSTRSIQLTDRNGCSLRPNLLKGFQRMNLSSEEHHDKRLPTTDEQLASIIHQLNGDEDDDGKDAVNSTSHHQEYNYKHQVTDRSKEFLRSTLVYFSSMNAFKFPEGNHVYFYCNIQICKGRCRTSSTDCKVRSNTKKLDVDSNSHNEHKEERTKDDHPVLKPFGEEVKEMMIQKKKGTSTATSLETTKHEVEHQDKSSSRSLEMELKLNKTVGIQNQHEITQDEHQVDERQKDMKEEDVDVSKEKKVLKKDYEKNESSIQKTDDHEENDDEKKIPQQKFRLMAKIINGTTGGISEKDILIDGHQHNTTDHQEVKIDEKQEKKAFSDSATLMSSTTANDDHDAVDDNTPSHDQHQMTAITFGVDDARNSSLKYPHHNRQKRSFHQQRVSSRSHESIKRRKRFAERSNGTSAYLPLSHSLIVISPMDGLKSGLKIRSWTSHSHESREIENEDDLRRHERDQMKNSRKQEVSPDKHDDDYDDHVVSSSNHDDHPHHHQHDDVSSADSNVVCLKFSWVMVGALIIALLNMIILILLYSNLSQHQFIISRHEDDDNHNRSSHHNQHHHDTNDNFLHQIMNSQHVMMENNNSRRSEVIRGGHRHEKKEEEEEGKTHADDEGLFRII